MHVSSEPFFGPFHAPFVQAAKEFSVCPSGYSIVDQFSLVRDRFANKKAVESDSAAYSYVELDAIANGVAQRILEDVSDSDRLVGLCVEDTALLVAAIIGVLKAGKGYLVLDSRYPRERIGMLLRESQTRLVIGDQGNVKAREVQKLGTGAHLLPLDATMSKATGNDPGIEIGAEDPALVMYTSGSTGVPRGVSHTHRSILAEIQEMTSAIKAGHKDNWLQYAPMSFASSIRSTFGSLLTGGTLVIYDIERFGFSRLPDTLVSRCVTIYRSLPSTFRHFMATLDEHAVFQNMRIVSLGGETVSPTDVARFNQHFHDQCVLMLSYGPTECLGACWGFVEHGAEPESTRLPLGYPRPSKNVVIIDEHGEEVPGGVVGEIAVTGRNISSGYWNDEDATRARFRVNPDGTRTFFTGDLGVREDGLITHVGRRDHQVKVRGFRIDAFEVEEELRRVHGIQDAVVTARPDRRDETRLVAYILRADESPNGSSDVREALSARLPNYMIPDVVETLDRFPMNSNGKIDRKAFPDPASWRHQEVSSHQWETATQRDIAHIWDQVGVNAANLDQTFLTLGGDSLGAAQIANHLSRHFGVDIPISRILDSSIGELESVVHASQRSAGE